MTDFETLSEALAMDLLPEGGDEAAWEGLYRLYGCSPDYE